MQFHNLDKISFNQKLYFYSDLIFNRPDRPLSSQSHQSIHEHGYWKTFTREVNKPWIDAHDVGWFGGLHASGSQRWMNWKLNESKSIPRNTIKLTELAKPPKISENRLNLISNRSNNLEIISSKYSQMI